MSAPLAKLPSGQSVTWKDGALVASHYANIMAIGMTPFDISLTFGEIANATVKEIEAVTKTKVILSPEQAHNLITLLSVALEKYIEGNGNLRAVGAVDKDLFLKALEANRADQLSEGQ